MSIRKRLYLSNILMVLTPIILTLVVLGVLFLAIIHIFGNNFYQQWKENEIYAKDYEKIEKFQNDWRNSDKRTSLEQEFQQFYENQPNRFISVFMYDSTGELLSLIHI